MRLGEHQNWSRNFVEEVKTLLLCQKSKLFSSNICLASKQVIYVIYNTDMCILRYAAPEIAKIDTFRV